MEKQFGQRIVTLEEASQSESAANQMAKQIQLLTSGPLKMVNTQKEAIALLEAMAKGETKLEAPTKEEALNQAVERGNQIRHRQLNQLEIANNKLQYLANMADLQVYKETRAALGAESPIEAIRARIEDEIEKAQGATQNIKGLSGRGEIEAGPGYEKQLEEGPRMLKEAKEVLGRAKDIAMDKITSVTDKAKEEKKPQTLADVAYSDKGEKQGKTDDEVFVRRFLESLTNYEEVPAVGRPPEPATTVNKAMQTTERQTRTQTYGAGRQEKPRPEGEYHIDVVCAGCQQKQLEAVFEGALKKMSKAIEQNNSSIENMPGARPV
jgi:hypothetical protein